MMGAAAGEIRSCESLRDADGWRAHGNLPMCTFLLSPKPSTPPHGHFSRFFSFKNLNKPKITTWNAYSTI
jgi:hypothetical protein